MFKNLWPYRSENSTIKKCVFGVTFGCFNVSAAEQSFQHNEREESGHGGRREEEVCDEASSGGPSGNKENLLRQLHRHLQTVSLPADTHAPFRPRLSMPVKKTTILTFCVLTDFSCTSSQVASSA